jgi:hypothetical protein
MTNEKNNITLQVPAEFLELCLYDMVHPEKVLRGFIADLCGFGRPPDSIGDGYHSNGSEDRGRAMAYYDLLHGWHAQWIRDNVPHLDTKKPAPVTRQKRRPASAASLYVVR